MNTQQSVVYVGSGESQWQDALDGLAEPSALPGVRIEKMQNAKKAVKYLRKNPQTAVIIVVFCSSDIAAIEYLSKSIRDAMHNQTVRIMVCAEDTDTAGIRLVRELGVNAVLMPGQDHKDRLLSQVSAELHTNALMSGTQVRHQAETDMLSAIARFSRLEMKLSACLAELVQSTGLLTGASMVNVIMARRNGLLKRSSLIYQAEGVDASEWLSQDQEPISPQLLTVVEEARLQLRVQADDPELIAASKAMGCEIAGRFIYPLRSFGRTMCLVECWLPADGLKLVSVDLVRLIEKSSEQFSLLFERKQADSELKRQYKRLKFTLDELSTTQNALYHSEKLASLGQLAAGIAHEINNPVAYVMGNFNPLNEYVDSMTKMLDLHSQFVSLIDESDVSVGSELRQQIDKVGTDLDMDYVMEDVRSLVSDSKDGLVRVREIIVNLNEFARQDSVDIAPTDLNASIEGTLKVLKGELHQRIEIQLSLGELPLVSCQAGLINQVLLNVIKNGAQSMADHGVIKISSKVESDYVVVRVRDSGSGIPPDVLEKIFDPFFTTKPVGEGTGLGLSLCHGIVERHHGVLEVSETSAEGTEFRLALPIDSVNKHSERQAA